MLELLDGLKTYLIAALVIITGVLSGLGYLSEELTGTIITILIGGGLATLRAGIAKV